MYVECLHVKMTGWQMKGNNTLLRRSLLSKDALYGDHICPSVHASRSVSVRTVSLIFTKFAHLSCSKELSVKPE